MEIGESVRGEDVYIIQVIHKKNVDLQFSVKDLLCVHYQNFSLTLVPTAHSLFLGNGGCGYG